MSRKKRRRDRQQKKVEKRKKKAQTSSRSSRRQAVVDVSTPSVGDKGGADLENARGASKLPSKPTKKTRGPVILKVRNLRTDFHTPNGVVHAVQGMSFDLHKGEILGIVGESGSGKSVTNLSLMGLIRKPGVVTADTLEFDGQFLQNLPDAQMRKIRGKRIAMIFQDPMTSLNPFLTVGDQIAESLELHENMSTEQAIKKATSLLEDVGIPDPAGRVHQYPHEFSGGMRQRVMIAMALACDPEILIADEPTTALDVTIQAQILELLKRLRDQRGMAVILITHDLGVVAGSCDRVIVMYAGRIAEQNETRPIFKNPGHPYTAALLKSIPRIDSSGKGELHPIEGMPPDLSKTLVGCPFEPRCEHREASCKTTIPQLQAHGSTGLKACDVAWNKKG
ncbi:MAG: ABC transporter ATP-binding protein [Planctomycetota bacterium]|nr:ABC transporter ATP-binding protein [Planctomycetota bacterium]